jgi:hypothetical protein
VLLGIGSSKELECLHISASFNLYSAHFVLESAKYYAFGNYAKNRSDDTCRLVSGEGVHLNFSISKTGNTVIFRKQRYGQGEEAIVFLADFPAPRLPDWALNLAKANSGMMRQYVPKPFAEIEKIEAAKQKIIDDEKTAANKLEQEKNQAQTAADTAKLRAEIATLNPGQLFVKANELASSGDSAKAQEVRNALISRFPNHALAAQAAAQMAGGSSGASQGGGNTTRAASNTSTYNGPAFNVADMDVCGRGGEGAKSAINAIVERYQRFNVTQVQGVIQEAKSNTTAQMVSRAIGMTGNVSAAIASVTSEMRNYQAQMAASADTFCKVNSGCNNPASLGWPDKMSSGLPQTSNSFSGGVATVFLNASLIYDLNSVLLKALRCQTR